MARWSRMSEFHMQHFRVSDTLVSIVIPCFGGARFLGHAISSCLSQSYENIEIIVVDDASPDDCADIAATFAASDPRVKVIRKLQNGGVSAAFNTGFAASRGSYMTRLAQDDYFRSDAIKLMKDCLDSIAEAGLVCCDMQVIDESGMVVGQREACSSPSGILDGRAGLCFMWRRGVWETVGPFNSEFDAAEDYEYLLRVSKRYSACKIDGDAPFFLRVHDEMGSRRFKLSQALAIHKARARHCGSMLSANIHLSDGYFEAAYILRSEGRFLAAIGFAIRCMLRWPFRTRNYRLLAATLRDCVRAFQRARLASLAKKLCSS